VEFALVIAVIVIALAFDCTNGFHDAANAIATSISTRALTPRVALLLAAVMNLLGALVAEGSPARSAAGSSPRQRTRGA
jgi:PiT family inorganic phosphate transporter